MPRKISAASFGSWRGERTPVVLATTGSPSRGNTDRREPLSKLVVRVELSSSTSECGNALQRVSTPCVVVIRTVTSTQHRPSDVSVERDTTISTVTTTKSYTTRVRSYDSRTPSVGSVTTSASASPTGRPSDPSGTPTPTSSSSIITTSSSSEHHSVHSTKIRSATDKSTESHTRSSIESTGTTRSASGSHSQIRSADTVSTSPARRKTGYTTSTKTNKRHTGSLTYSTTTRHSVTTSPNASSPFHSQQHHRVSTAGTSSSELPHNQPQRTEAPAPPAGNSKSPSAGLIVGATAGVVVAFALILVLAALCLRMRNARKRRKLRQNQSTPRIPTPSFPPPLDMSSTLALYAPTEAGSRTRAAEPPPRPPRPHQTIFTVSPPTPTYTTRGESHTISADWPSSSPPSHQRKLVPPPKAPGRAAAAYRAQSRLQQPQTVRPLRLAAPSPLSRVSSYTSVSTASLDSQGQRRRSEAFDLE